MRAVTLVAEDDFEGWRDAARALAGARIPPSDLVWQVGEADLFAQAEPLPPPKPIRVPRPFLELAETVILNSDPQRFALLYTLLTSLLDHPERMSDAADPLVQRLQGMAKQVRRDIHKMRAFVRFREVAESPPFPGTGEPATRFIAWFEPEHHIVRANARFFVDRFTSMRWSILTPDLSIHWDGETLTEGPGATKGDAPEGDPIEDVWKTYYASTFNPARLKVGMMLKEMPRRYWKNMPETALVSSLIAGARAREIVMVQTAPTGGNIGKSWEKLRDEASACTRCDLHRCATRTVFGEGPLDAGLMFVGEQPGDNEDLEGKPFVGPAGQMFDRAIGEAGIDRDTVYVTNAVKHFKFEQRGKRRIHDKPNAGEISACRWWYEQERLLLRPKVTVALGATAARQMLGKAVTITATRGRAIDLADGGQGWVTIHPSFLLRLPDKARAKDEYAAFVEDLKGAKALLR